MLIWDDDHGMLRNLAWLKRNFLVDDFLLLFLFLVLVSWLVLVALKGFKVFVEEESVHEVFGICPRIYETH
jgi:hypothetical protein